MNFYDVQVFYLLRLQNRAELSSGSSEDSRHSPVSQKSNLHTFTQCVILVNVIVFYSNTIKLLQCKLWIKAFHLCVRGTTAQ